MDRARLLVAIEILARSEQGEDAHIAALLEKGFAEDEAHRAVAFIPVGLARPLIEQLGVTNFAECASVPRADGGWIEIRLADQPEYRIALSAARDHFEHGSLLQDAYEAIVFGTADVDAVSNALNEGVEVAEACLATAFCDERLAAFVIR